MRRVTKGAISVDLKPKLQAKKQRVSNGASSGNIGVARVVTVNYEEQKLTLRVVLGADQEFQRQPIAMTFPGAGARHFLGAMPEEGDYCIIGQMSQESDGRTSTPVILGWITPGTWVGHDWLVTQPFAPEEYGMSAKESLFTAGVYQRTRHKLRHMEPGNIVCSSSQGSDLVLNEDVLLTNRRGNEICLRDPDQAVVIRALQQFTALAGTRTYSGMVQRDATFLPSSMYADGTPWDGPQQIKTLENRPLTDSELREFAATNLFSGDLTPNPVFNRRAEDGSLGSLTSGVFFEDNVDPHEFLQRGGFLNADGRTVDGREQSDAVYGGKSLYRVSASQGSDGRPLNAVLGVGDQSNAYTEHRLEIAHTSNGCLPVTEQTDGLDAERLSRTDIAGKDLQGRSSLAPFLEGRKVYGLPLKPVIFDSTGGPSPSLESASNAALGDQAAMLFRMFPPVTDAPGPATFWSVTKDGRFKASIGGPQSAGFSAEVFLRSGLRVNTAGVLRLEAEGGLELNIANGDAKSNLGLNLSSDKGAVRVYGGGKTTQGVATAQTSPASGESNLPSLLLEGKDNVLVKSGRQVAVNTTDMLVRATNITQQSLSGIRLEAGDRIGLTSKTYDQVTNGKATYAYQGPKDNLPTNGAFRSTTFTGIGIGAVDELLVVQGDRSETFLLGNHSTTVMVGNLTYETNAGTWKARAGTNTLSVDVASGLSGQVLVGNIAFDAIAGTTMISGQVSFTAKTTGVAILSGTAGVTLGGPGKVGPIVCGADLDPLTGAPLATYGMGSPGHLLGTPI
jgi:hypothetical protein